MPDLLDFVIKRRDGSPAPQFTIEARVVDSSDQSRQLADLTGNRALQWPAVMTTLTDAQQDEIMNMVATRIVLWKAGV